MKTVLIKKQGIPTAHNAWFSYHLRRLGYDLQRFVDETGHKPKKVHRWITMGPEPWELPSLAATFVYAEKTGRARRFPELKRSPRGKLPRAADIAHESRRRKHQVAEDKKRILRDGQFVSRAADSKGPTIEDLRRIGADLIEEQQLEPLEGFVERVLEILPSGSMVIRERRHGRKIS